MPRSLEAGNYRLLAAFESSSNADTWYRLLLDPESASLSCDCRRWIYKRRDQETRSCPHTELGERLLTGVPAAARGIAATDIDSEALVAATSRWWGNGLRGQWSVESRIADFNGNSYLFLLLRLRMGNGGEASGMIAFACHHTLSPQRLQDRVAAWCGYAIASEIARLGGYPLAGRQPEHFKVQGGRQQRRGQTTLPQFGVSNLLRLADCEDLGDGLTPEQRAEEQGNRIKNFEEVIQ
jgi:hypothetical protein